MSKGPFAGLWLALVPVMALQLLASPAIAEETAPAAVAKAQSATSVLPLNPQAAILTPDWRAMTLADFKGTDQFEIRTEHGGMLAATGDFDGDGTVDAAHLAKSTDGGQFGLVILLDAKNLKSVIPYYTTTSFDEIARQGIALAEPGDYETACGKGYWTCAVGEPAKVTLKSPGIAFFTIESASAILMWDKVKNAFTLIALDD